MQMHLMTLRDDTNFQELLEIASFFASRRSRRLKAEMRRVMQEMFGDRLRVFGGDARSGSFSLPRRLARKPKQ